MRGAPAFYRATILCDGRHKPNGVSLACIDNNCDDLCFWSRESDLSVGATCICGGVNLHRSADPIAQLFGAFGG
jgi:hypothetical protein